MKKILQASLVIMMIVLLAVPFLRVEKDVPIEKIQKVVEKYISKDMQKQEMKIIKGNYKIKENEVEAIISYGPLSYINVDEITVLRQSDQDIRKTLLEKTLAHVDSVKKSFEGYGIEQTKLLKKAKVIEKGDYVICIVLENGKQVYDDIIHLFQ